MSPPSSAHRRRPPARGRSDSQGWRYLPNAHPRSPGQARPLWTPCSALRSPPRTAGHAAHSHHGRFRSAHLSPTPAAAAPPRPGHTAQPSSAPRSAGSRRQARLSSPSASEIGSSGSSPDSGKHPPEIQTIPVAARQRIASPTNLVFPTPASPDTSTRRASPPSAPCRWDNSRARPTKPVTAPPTHPAHQPEPARSTRPQFGTAGNDRGRREIKAALPGYPRR